MSALLNRLRQSGGAAGAPGEGPPAPTRQIPLFSDLATDEAAPLAGSEEGLLVKVSRSAGGAFSWIHTERDDAGDVDESWISDRFGPGRYRLDIFEDGQPASRVEFLIGAIPTPAPSQLAPQATTTHAPSVPFDLGGLAQLLKTIQHSQPPIPREAPQPLTELLQGLQTLRELAPEGGPADPNGWTWPAVVGEALGAVGEWIRKMPAPVARGRQPQKPVEAPARPVASPEPAAAPPGPPLAGPSMPAQALSADSVLSWLITQGGLDEVLSRVKGTEMAEPLLELVQETLEEDPE